MTGSKNPDISSLIGYEPKSGLSKERLLAARGLYNLNELALTIRSGRPFLSYRVQQTVAM
jgi:hypothetical protein